ncbi:MAG: NAD(P)-dependent oxidoreductase [Prevotellaceae bacterium]|nr:NAD(P)-dependent oxidoreductase [Candidatus Colivivens equi]
MKILITGSSGFIGSFLCEKALALGHEVWAGVRTHSSRRYLQLPGLRFLTIDLTDPIALQSTLSSVTFDVVIHAGGATKCPEREDFFRNNYDCTKHLVDALIATTPALKQFIYVSSLSVIGPSIYGASKMKSEEYLRSLHDFPYVIFRPTGVYGPRERDYLVMVKSIAHHIDYALSQDQKLTFVYVADLVDAIFAAIDKAVTRRLYNVADGQVYSPRAFSDLVQKELGIRFVLHIKSPLWFVKTVCYISDQWSRRITHRPSTLNRDKYLIMAQHDWTCDITPLREELGFTPQWDLSRGVKQTIRWYKENGWV